MIPSIPIKLLIKRLKEYRVFGSFLFGIPASTVEVPILTGAAKPPAQPERG